MKPERAMRLVIDSPPNATDDELLLLDLVAATESSLLAEIERASREDLIIVLDFVDGRVAVRVPSRATAAAVNLRVLEPPRLLAGEVAAAWLFARHRDVCMFLRVAAAPSIAIGNA